MKIINVFIGQADNIITNETNILQSEMISYGEDINSVFIKEGKKRLAQKLNFTKNNSIDLLNLGIQKHNENLDVQENQTFLSKFWEKFALPIIIGVIVGVIVLIIALNYQSSSNDKNGTIPKVDSTNIITKQNSSDSSINENKTFTKNNSIKKKKYIEVFLQTQDVRSIFDDTLTIAYTSFMEAVNQKLELKISKLGLDSIFVAELGIGEKVFFKEYEILFFEARPNISTYDVTLRVFKIK